MVVIGEIFAACKDTDYVILNQGHLTEVFHALRQIMFVNR